MSRRAIVLILALGCGSPAERQMPLVAGSVAPPLLAASSENAVRATWVFDGGDLLRCRSSARELRHLQARFGPSVEIAAVAVDANPQAVESFLRFERVSASIRYIRTGQGHGHAGIRRPALYVVRGHTIRAVYLGVPLDDTRSIRARDSESAVASLLGRSGADEGQPITRSDP